MLLFSDGSGRVWYTHSVTQVPVVGHDINTDTTGITITGASVPLGAHIEPSKNSFRFKFAFPEILQTYFPHF